MHLLHQILLRPYWMIATVLNIFLDIYFDLGFAQLKMTKRHTGGKAGNCSCGWMFDVDYIDYSAIWKILMMIFTDTAELVNLSVRVMRILAAGYIAVAVTQSLSGVMRGAGDTVTPMVISLITTIVIRVPVSLLICWLMGAVLTTIFYKVGRWKKTSLQ